MLGIGVTMQATRRLCLRGLSLVPEQQLNNHSPILHLPSLINRRPGVCEALWDGGCSPYLCRGRDRGRRRGLDKCHRGLDRRVSGLKRRLETCLSGQIRLCIYSVCDQTVKRYKWKHAHKTKSQDLLASIGAQLRWSDAVACIHQGCDYNTAIVHLFSGALH